MERVRAVVGLVCGRWTKWIVLVLWVVVAFGLAGPLANNLTGVQKDDAVQWLPGNAEATRVVQLQEMFQPTDIFPAVVVYERPSGITAADRDKVGHDATRLAGVDGVSGSVIGPVEAKDGQALQLIVPIVMGADGYEKIGQRVDAVRAIAGADSAGLNVHVSGPAGIAADASKAFGSTNTTLLFTTVLVVIVILLLAYRSPTLWILPVVSVFLALTTAQAVIYLLAKNANLTVNSQSAGILTVLVFGVGTDYALLLVARYREELRRQQDRHQAMAVALRRAGPAILASGITVILAMLCLTVADMNSTKGLGPVCAIGIAVGLLAMLTLLPALLVIFGRWMFWPARPRLGSADPASTGMWARLGKRIAARPRLVWITSTVVLGLLALGMVQLNAVGLTASDAYVNRPDAVVGQEVIGRHFPAGQGQPVVVIGKADASSRLRDALAGTPGITDVTEPVVRAGLVYLEGTVTDQPDTDAARATVDRVRGAVHAVPGADAEVGGTTATGIDMNRANARDDKLIVPLVLFVVFVILGVLLRAVIAPLLLTATVVLSVAAALGLSTLLFVNAFGWAHADSSFPLMVFVLLVALGIDYNIFLMTRVREEARRHGVRPGVLIGLAATGGVITSAGLVLAATFGVLASLPLVFLAEIGGAVALGVLLDTFVVRSVLVPALSLDLGRWMWWPGTLAGRDTAVPEREPSSPSPTP